MYRGVGDVTLYVAVMVVSGGQKAFILGNTTSFAASEAGFSPVVDKKSKAGSFSPYEYVQMKKQLT